MEHFSVRNTDRPSSPFSLNEILCIKQAASLGIYAIIPASIYTEASAVRRDLEEYGSGQLRLFWKIRCADDLAHLEDILPCVDEVILARAYLGSFCPLWKIPGLQKRLAAACSAADRPYMIASQLLSSMEHSPKPTAAELNDVFHAVEDGASSLMLTGETAVGSYPAEAIRYLKKTVSEAQETRSA